ncbi:MADS-box transcription factor 13-like isoform X2 [Cornus florida]|uniref:MADS-box transcription factor 13-like isoform X2 n=1 Tax=Cornus florida TaxID=4283 RepID=UPI00289BF0DD|nr:MADS-box transcription factor 13-like isoform X2 [Cornus florida]
MFLPLLLETRYIYLPFVKIFINDISKGTPMACLNTVKVFYQQELKKLQQQIDMLQNTNRYLTGEGCSLNAKELEQMENRLEQGIARIKSKKVGGGFAALHHKLKSVH